MFDFAPRDYDSRDDERFGPDRDRGSRGGSDYHDRNDDWTPPDIRSRDRDDNARELGRGPGDSRQSDEHSRNPTTTRAGQIATATLVSATTTRVTYSRATSACRARWSGRSFGTATASTPCGARNPAR